MPFYVKSKGGGSGGNIIGDITLSGGFAETIIGQITSLEGQAMSESEIQTFYPTSGLADRSFNSIMTAFYDCFKSIPTVTDFFDSVEKTGEEGSNYTQSWINFSKGKAYIQIRYYDAEGRLRFCNNTTTANYSNTTDPTLSIDITVKHSVGINGTNAIWLDIFYYGVCMVFNKFEDKYFIANSAASSSTSSNMYSFYYSDTGGQVGTLAKPFNGDNIGKAAEYIAQPYYHYGVNTGDIYTFDGGGAEIPLGKFKLGDSEFVKLYGNFALRIK